MFEKLAKRLAKSTKDAVKKEAAQYIVDVLPVVVGLASVAGLLMGMVPPKKVTPSTITINNYYYGK